MIIGIDVSKSSFDSAWAVSGKANHKVYDYSDKGIAELLGTAQSRHTRHLIR